MPGFCQFYAERPVLVEVPGHRSGAECRADDTIGCGMGLQRLVLVAGN